MPRPIHHVFAPLGDREQCTLALSMLVRPWTWREGPARQQLRDALKEQFNGDTFLFSSGREALLTILRLLKLTPGEEIIVQGYTCVVVPNAIMAAGCVPVYVDIDRDTLNLTVDEVEKAITPKTRAVICQHTFGIPADTAALRKVCDTHSLLLIEDCAHIMPDETGPKEIGEYGDFLFFSFGRDKAISGVTGGAVICRTDDLCQHLKREEEKAASVGLLTIMRLLLYPLLYALARPLYASGIGKGFLAFCGKLRLLIPIVTRQEKEGEMSPTVHGLPNACATLVLAQLKKLKEMNDHRRQLTNLYLQAGIEHEWFEPKQSDADSPLPLAIHPDLPLQKFPFFVPNANRLRAQLKRKNIHLNDGWTNCVVCPVNCDPQKAMYEAGKDPRAEQVCESIISLPTHPGMSERQAQKLIRILNTLLSSAL